MKKHSRELTTEELSKIKDEDIDFSDIPELGDEFWKNATLLMPKPKKAIGMRIDDDVIAWFKKQGKGYQSHMNAVLRAYAFSRKNI